MNNKEEFLTEERYHRTKSKIQKIALCILTVGLLIGFSVIGIGIKKNIEVNKEYSEETRTKKMADLKEKIDVEKERLNRTADELREKGASEETPFFDQTKEDKQLELITEVLEGDKRTCIGINDSEESPIYNYCILKNEYNELKSMDLEFKRSFEGGDCIPFYMIGAFLIIASLMISGSIYISTKGREMLAYNVQQVMPVAQEGIEKMTPTMKKVTEEMAPAYGTVAKEISKGIKEGLNEANKEDK